MKSIVLVIFLLAFSPAISQTTGNIAGVQTACAATGQGRTGNFIISYTIGEMILVDSWQQNGLLITQGIHQPDNRGVFNATGNDCFSTAEVKVYPNPNPGTFQLQLSLFQQGHIQLNLVDGAGKTCFTEAFDYTGFTTRPYAIGHLASGTYFLQLWFTATGQTQARKCAYTVLKTN